MRAKTMHKTSFHILIYIQYIYILHVCLRKFLNKVVNGSPALISDNESME